jgi:DNA (cytosine-5)-methyltransferase 1
MPSSDQIIYISSTSTSPAPESATAPSEERIHSSPDPISLEIIRTDATAPPAKKRNISSDTGLYTPKSVKGDSPMKQTSDIHSGRKLSHVQVPRTSLPSVAYIGGKPDKQAISENEAFWEFGELPEVDGSQYVELNDFTIYRPSTNKRSMEMCTLDKLNTARGVDQLIFSWMLSTATATTAYYVHGIAFGTLAIEGYGDTDCVDLAGRISIQSRSAQLVPAWFRLGKPSVEYKGFHEDYVWLATFTKYFADFLLEEKHVTLHLFRSDFLPWLLQQYGDKMEFQSWHKQCGFQQDFGTSAAAWVRYLHKECYSIDYEELDLLRHPVWSETGPVLNAIERQPTKGSDATVVTPFVRRYFDSMYFASHLQTEKPCDKVLAAIVRRKQELCLTPWYAAPTAPPRVRKSSNALNIRQGDVVCVNPNADDQWKRSKATIWYAYV